MFSAVPVLPKRFKQYEKIIGEEATTEIRELAAQLKGARVLHLNATAFGGGVAELLGTLVPLMRDLGLDCDWQVMHGTDRFFTVTKALHNSLQGASHWSVRRMAQRTGMSPSTVQRIWAELGLKPHRTETFKFSTDPALEAKIRDVVGLYLDPPAGAIVLSLDEKTQIQALDRTQPMLPMWPGQVERHTHDYARHGTTCLFAALEVATGRVTTEARTRHTGADFLAFLRHVERAYPAGELHVVLDNVSTHKTPDVLAWLARHPRVAFHFTPTSASWMNQIETWFGILTRQAIRRGSFKSVKELIAMIDAFTRQWNDGSSPFIWLKNADEILAKAVRKPRAISESGH